MNYEFRGRTLQEAVKNSLGPKQSRQCDLLSVEFGNLSVELSLTAQRLGRVEDQISRLEDQIQDEARTAPHDRARQVLNIALAVGSLFPAFTAVRLAATAVRAARTVARARAAASSTGNAVASVSALSLIGLDFLTPSTRRQLESAKRDADRLVNEIDRLNNKIDRVLDQMERAGYNAILV